MARQACFFTDRQPLAIGYDWFDGTPQALGFTDAVPLDGRRYSMPPDSGLSNQATLHQGQITAISAPIGHDPMTR